MPYTYSQLVGIRDHAKRTQGELSALYGMLVSGGFVDPRGDMLDPDPKYPFESPAVRFDDMGFLCRDIIDYTNDMLRAMDERREKVRKERYTQNTEVVCMRTSRWW